MDSYGEQRVRMEWVVILGVNWVVGGFEQVYNCGRTARSSAAHSLKKKGSVGLSVKSRANPGEPQEGQENPFWVLCPLQNQEAPYFNYKAATPWDINIALPS